MELLKKFTLNKSVVTRAFLLLVMAIAITVIGYMFGKFAWYLSH